MRVQYELRFFSIKWHRVRSRVILDRPDTGLTLWDFESSNASACFADELDQRMEIFHEFAAAGLTHITLGLHDDADEAIRLIGERVIPALATA